MPPNSVRPAELMSRLLDRGYTQATRQTIEAIASAPARGRLAQSLKDFDAEAQRLASVGLSVSPESAVFRALVSDFGNEVARQALLVDATAPNVGQIGIDAAGRFQRQMALPGLTDQDLRGIGIGWNTPDPDAVNAAVNFTNGQAWRDELERFGRDVPNQLRQMIIRSIVNGEGAASMTAKIRASMSALPSARANTLLRTVQMQSYRVASAIHQNANADILSEQIRIAALDDRTCLCCIAEHGKRMPVGEVILDHHNGRCTSIAVVKGRTVSVQTGETWFNAQSAGRQEMIAGGANYRAIKAGAASLNDFVERYDDRVFGQMVHEASLKNVLGETKAKAFYSV